MPGQDVSTRFGEIIARYFEDFASGVETRACHDQYVGKVDLLGYCGWSGVNRFECRRSPDPRRDLNPIILVLESPHTQEYPPDQSPQPANGTTGVNIRKYLGVALHQLCLSDSRPLILMNAIQHQCSAGVTPKVHRDKIFQLMWRDQCVREDFTRRLRKYIAGGEDFRVVNACTQGKVSPELWKRVEATICTTLGRPSDLSIPHPANWIPPRGATAPIIMRRT